uniref:snRNA-activating protein complex subunit 1 n=2 Tax=Mesocestoides corti TaxID=53468 RepID=A0A5K3ERX7_MESCO
MLNKDYCLYTINSPIIGLEEDLKSFLDEFVEIGSPRFSDFAELWKKNKFIHLMYGRQTQAGLKDVLEGIFFFLIRNISSEVSSLIKIGSLFLIYAFFGKQPIVKQARVNVTLDAWNALSMFSSDLSKQNHWDAYYIFRQLCVKSAFRFVANAEDLYPGVPLYTRSNISLPLRRTFLTKVQRRQLTDSNKLKNVQSSLLDTMPARFNEFPEHLHANWPAICRAINQYVEAKRDIAQLPGPSGSGDVNVDETDDPLLWSLNLVNNRDSIAPISDLLDKFSSDANSFDKTQSHIKENSDDIGRRRKQLRHAENWSKVGTRKSPRKKPENS